MTGNDYDKPLWDRSHIMSEKTEISVAELHLQQGGAEFAEAGKYDRTQSFGTTGILNIDPILKEVEIVSED